jgi:hypothetical protein
MRLVGVVLLAATIVAVDGGANASIHSTASGTRPCGTLAVGIGWHLVATPNVTCASARRLIATYFERRDNRQASAVVYRYVCTRRDVPDGEHIRCSRSTRLVIAKSFGY